MKAVVLETFLARILRPHQRKGVTFLWRCLTGRGDAKRMGRGAILADDMVSIEGRREGGREQQQQKRRYQYLFSPSLPPSLPPSSGPRQDPPNHRPHLAPDQAVPLPAAHRQQQQRRRGESCGRHPFLSPRAVGRRSKKVALVRPLPPFLPSSVPPFLVVSDGGQGDGNGIRTKKTEMIHPSPPPSFPPSLPSPLPPLPQVRLSFMVVDSAMGKALGKGDAKEQVSTFCTSSAQHSTVLFISYEGYRLHSAALNKCQQIGLLVCDEAHRLKEGGSKTLAALAACPARARLSLTGTPVQNDLEVGREGGREGREGRRLEHGHRLIHPPSLPSFRNSTP